jgi:hypothetical protein
MFSAGSLTFQEFVAREKLPLAFIQDAVMEFLRGRGDAVVIGAMAVNAYVKEPRMTPVVDLVSPYAEKLAHALRDYRRVASLPPNKRISKVLVVTPAELIAGKVIGYHQRRGQPKSGTDWRDVAMLLLTFPELKRDYRPVVERLQAAGVDQAVLEVWKELVAQEIQPMDNHEF